MRGFDSHLGHRLFMCPLMVDSLYFPFSTLLFKTSVRQLSETLDFSVVFSRIFIFD